MYYCHQCSVFISNTIPDAELIQCDQCRSPLIERVQNSLQHSELVEIMLSGGGNLIEQDPSTVMQNAQELIEIIFTMQETERTSPPVDVDELMGFFTIHNGGLSSVGGQGCLEDLANSSCCVCLESNIECGSDVVVLPCNHCYHVGCIRQWLSESATCPICRVSLVQAQPDTNATTDLMGGASNA
uniref:RING-type domain-containing protein n=1 Tax=Trypanosoma congolense (strain IL3000) TaxID=1068625 RepID=G0UV89_TRYCI|nr:conserved hypothetical protein [Trypanosoma congolense IL3000]